MIAALKTILVFFAFFRPALINPSIPSTLLVLVGVFLWALRHPHNLFQPLQRLGAAGFALLFILIWSFAIDLITGSLSAMQLRSQFATSVRFLLYIYIAFYIVEILTKDRIELRKIILWAVAVQSAIALAMLIDLRVKLFFFQTISGYSGSEKVFRDYFFSVRIFGWSEELFYAAPAMMLSAVILFYRASYFKWVSSTSIVAVIAILNARVAALAIILFFSQGRGIATVSAALIAIAFGGGAAFTLSNNAGQFYEISNYLLSDFSGGKSRTLEILQSHIFFPGTAIEWIFGSQSYYYGETAIMRSDIGYVIALMFGGIIYLGAWVLLLARIIIGCTNSWVTRALLGAIFIGLGVKGLIFSGNAMTLLILVMYFDQRRTSRSSDNSRIRNSRVVGFQRGGSPQVT